MNISYNTKRLSLRILQARDADKVLAFYKRNKFHFEPWEAKRAFNFYTLSYQRASLTIEEDLMKRKSLLRLWIFLKDKPDLIIGTVNFYNIKNGDNASCQIGYKIDRKYIKKGYAYEAIKFSIELMQEKYNLHRIEAKIMPKNLASIKLIEKLGFKCEGLSPSKVKINGRFEDHFIYSYISISD